MVDIIDPKLYGILNGIDMDHYDRRSDLLILPYQPSRISGKARCKGDSAAIRLNQESEWPLLASVARWSNRRD